MTLTTNSTYEPKQATGITGMGFLTWGVLTRRKFHAQHGAPGSKQSPGGTPSMFCYWRTLVFATSAQ
jgi:hypothetical protein